MSDSTDWLTIWLTIYFRITEDLVLFFIFFAIVIFIGGLYHMAILIIAQINKKALTVSQWILYLHYLSVVIIFILLVNIALDNPFLLLNGTVSFIFQYIVVFDSTISFFMKTLSYVFHKKVKTRKIISYVNMFLGCVAIILNVFFGFLLHSM